MQPGVARCKLCEQEGCKKSCPWPWWWSGAVFGLWGLLGLGAPLLVSPSLRAAGTLWPWRSPRPTGAMPCPLLDGHRVGWGGTVALGVAGTGGRGRGDVLVLVLMCGDITSISPAPLCQGGPWAGSVPASTIRGRNLISYLSGGIKL